MAHSSANGFCKHNLLKILLSFFMVVLLYGRIVGRNSRDQDSCPSCDCDGSSDDHLFDLPSRFSNISYPDCGKHDPELKTEMEKGISNLLAEELVLVKTVGNETLSHTKTLILDAKKSSSHNEKEAEKCNAGVETCEQARERAEAELINERKISALWENRSRQYGWKDKRIYFS